jgi:hypothetical protein
MALKAKTLTQVKAGLIQDPKAFKKLWEEFELLGERNFRMNYVYLFEHRGVHLVDALQAIDNIVAAMKELKKEEARHEIVH